MRTIMFINFNIINMLILLIKSQNKSEMLIKWIMKYKGE